MSRVHGLSPTVSSAGFAVAAALGLTLYSPGGRWCDRFGPVRVLRAALILRLAAFLALFLLGILRPPGQGGLALLALAVLICGWSLQSVSGTALAAQLSPIGEGPGMGLFNAVTALAGVLGAALGGWVAGPWGYRGVPLVAVMGIGLGLLMARGGSAGEEADETHDAPSLPTGMPRATDTGPACSGAAPDGCPE